jgi:hypothetical protein
MRLQFPSLIEAQNKASGLPFHPEGESSRFLRNVFCYHRTHRHVPGGSDLEGTFCLTMRRLRCSECVDVCVYVCMQSFCEVCICSTCKDITVCVCVCIYSLVLRGLYFHVLHNVTHSLLFPIKIYLFLTSFEVNCT